jgi:hypothetical protein
MASWTAVEGAAAYEVWYGTADDSGAAQKHNEDPTELSAALTGLENGTAYYVWVKAKNSAGTSGFSPSASGTPQAATVTPDAPVAPTVTAGERQLIVSWTAVSGATAYEVWYGTADDSGAAQKHGEDITALTTIITSLENGTAYYVWVKAKNSVGTSGFSPPANKAPYAGADDATLSRFRPIGYNKLNRQHVFPRFTPANETYTLPVDYWVDSIQLELSVTQTGATVTSSSGTKTQSGKVYTFSHDLTGGDNNISFTVTAPNGLTTKTYAIVINRDAYDSSGAENVIPPWLLGFWSFVYDTSGSTECVTITDVPSKSQANLGRLEFDMGMGMGLAGDIVYSKEFGGRSGILILQLESKTGSINDPTNDGTGFYAVYYFNKLGDGGLGTTARIFQSNQNGSAAAFAALPEAKAAFIVDNWYSVNLTTIDMVGDPQIKRPNDWVWDGTVDYWDD